MSKTSQIDEIIQQLDTLSLKQLLEVREKVDALIKGKTVKFNLDRADIGEIQGTAKAETEKGNQKEWVRVWDVTERGIRKSLEGTYIIMVPVEEDAPLDFIESPSIPEEVDAENESLEDAIKLVEEWMSDESGYDEETYPQIEAALNQNRLSL